jgi:hypothetical protein
MTIIKSIALALGATLLSIQANAADPYLVRQASELEALSYAIAGELRYSGEHSSLRREAEQLAREASRFRDAVDGRHDHRYVQTRYSTLSNHFGSFDRRYHQSSFGPQYRNINRSYISITATYRGLDSSYSRYANSWDRGYREPERVVIYKSAPSRSYRPFGLFVDKHDNRGHKSSRSVRRFNDRYVDRHDSRGRSSRNSRNSHDDRGRRNHYK